MSNVVRCQRSNEPDTVGVEPNRSTSAICIGLTELTGTEFARKWGITPRALRFYEKRGLMSPRRRGPVRIYCEADGHRVGLILRAKKLGFTLAEVGQMIDIKEGAPLPQDLQLTAERCLQQIGHLQERMKGLIEAMAELRRIHLDLCRKAGDATGDASR
jgi:DNA-binding transcriptional MerR regulator